MEIGATLGQLDLSASDPQALAAFYAKTFRLDCTEQDGTFICSAPERRLTFTAGAPAQLRRVTLRFGDRAAFDAHRATLLTRAVALIEDTATHYALRDPKGHEVAFQAPEAAPAAPAAAPPSGLSARLQHFALRTQRVAPLADFYINQLGFIASDRVYDDDGDLTAIFMRTDSEHHTLALFRAPQDGFDHFSCETHDWTGIRDWADHMASVGVELAWGVGRHGPGNDTFLMVRDGDGNMGEISAEMETCVPNRPVGTWPHRMLTLNQWGVAILRS